MKSQIFYIEISREKYVIYVSDGEVFLEGKSPDSSVKEHVEYIAVCHIISTQKPGIVQISETVWKWVCCRGATGIDNSAHRRCAKLLLQHEVKSDRFGLLHIGGLKVITNDFNL